ncbi:DinB/UmuC family translesion DNA polymerase, partial [Staphylococcus pseudintermedius]|uniref:DinB/UmuC family translesion DNA polymerase n=1 Tax=Staphylococcus pseudintermedius TaxID=283734 RepID=UPI000D998913
TNPSICKSQILMHDYTYEDAKVVMQELIEDVGMRVRLRKMRARTIHFSFGYKDCGGVHRQFTLDEPTNLEKGIWTGVEKWSDQLCEKELLY